MSLSSSFRIKTSPHDIRKDGTTAIYLYLNINGEIKMIRTGKYVTPAFFDNTRGIVKKGNGDSTKMNLLLEEFKNQYVKAAYELEYRNKIVTHEVLNSKVNNKNQDDFMVFAYAELRLVIETSSMKYWKVLKFHLDTLKLYKSKILFDELNYTFLENYKIWMIRKGFKINTMAGAFRCIRLFVYKAKKQDLTSISPFANFKIQSQETKIDFLTKEELICLHDLYDQNSLCERLQNTLHYFLISCYTGLRRSNCSRIKKDFIQNNVLKLVPKKTQRTGKEVTIPLNENVKKLLDMEADQLFKKPLKQSNSRTNNDLKEIMQELKIKKHITFHCSRHSFAVLSLTLGIPIEVVSSILGHSSIKTTQIYAKVVDDLKTREMKKWDF